jgi:hypothetical protein
METTPTPCTLAERTLTPDRAIERERITDILRDTGALCLWDPREVDGALELVTCPGSIEAVASDLAGVRGDPDRADDLIEVIRLGHPRLALSWQRTYARGLLVRSERVYDAAGLEEVRQCVADQIVTLSHTFLSCSPSRPPVSWGYEAYLHGRLIGLLRPTCRRYAASAALGAVAYDPALHEPSEPERVTASADRACLVHALREALSDDFLWDLFHGITYEGRGLRDLAGSLGLSRSRLSELCRSAILPSLRQSLGVCTESGADFSSLTEACGDAFTEGDFRRLVPRPPTKVK